MLLYFVRYTLLGPVLGACIGLTQAVIAAGVWVAHGQPDFYFRGWDGVQVTSVVLLLGGLITGAPFGAAVAAGEHLLKRRVWVAPAFVGAAIAAALVTWATVEIEFSRQELLPAFAQQGLAVAIAGGLLLALSRPVRPNRSPVERSPGLIQVRDY
jgi:hypothetical protein